LWGPEGTKGQKGQEDGPVSGFPMIGKIFRHFSNDWKKCFQSLENSPGARFRRGGKRLP
jgi:hypothetical protein